MKMSPSWPGRGVFVKILDFLQEKSCIPPLFQPESMI